MKVSQERFKEKLRLFANESIIPKINHSGMQFLMGGGYGLMEPKLMSQMHELGLIDGDGNVDMDTIEHAIKHGFRASKDKAEFCVLGVKLTFSPTDWNTFKQMF